MRLLFTSRPQLGHFQPLVALARVAQQRGHAVCFATAAPMTEYARSLGFEAETAGLGDAASVAERDAHGIVFRGLSPDEIRPLAFGRWFAGLETPPRLADLDRICAQFHPDVLVHEIAELAAPLAAATAGLPWITIGFGPLLQPDTAALAREGVTPLWQARGFPTPKWAGLYHHLYVDPCPAALQIAAIRDLPAVVRIRPAAGRSSSAADLSPKAKRVYLTFGTIFNSASTTIDVMRIAVAGCVDVASEVLATVGRDVDPAVLGPQPTNVQVSRFIPQDDILPTCRCVVAHGGSGTLLGALAWGVPLLMLPQGADQFYNADRATRAGVALALRPEEVSRSSVADLLGRLFDEKAFAARAAEVRADMMAMPAADEVLARIEQASALGL